ncbi:uncharacterized protein yc1106_09878 [Curvularia clavata]|uniref:Uncharacterized protein n=1 Tax=Curvularia clavata TaxID=95742 RepID=A0A9Q8ZH51_CURCL|nr:uncharacterized protein yc1106_09878 [Curvularia clavata]
MSPNHLLSVLPCAVTPTLAQGAKVAFPAEYIIEHILKLSIYLIGLSNASKFFKRVSVDPYIPSLYTLLDRLHSKQLVPSRLPWGFQSVEHIMARIHLRADKEAAFRPLADFEDIYYALLARMQEVAQLIDLRIQSGFNDESTIVCKGGPTLSELHACLLEYWEIFNDPRCAKALDDAVREARAQEMREEIIRQVDNRKISMDAAREQLGELFNPDVYNGILGLHFVRDWAPAIVSMYLEHKYQPVFDVEKLDESEQEIRLSRTAERRAQLAALQETRREQQTQEQPRPMREPMSAADVSDAIYEALSEEDPSKKDEVREILERLSAITMTAEEHGYQYSYEWFLREAQEYHGQFLNSTIYDVHETALDAMLNWQVKSQRVEEYSEYLRSRASQDVQNIVGHQHYHRTQNTNSADGFKGDSTTGEGYKHPEMDMTDRCLF